MAPHQVEQVAALAQDTQPNDWVEFVVLVREVISAAPGRTELMAGVDGNQLSIITPAPIPDGGMLLDALKQAIKSELLNILQAS